MAVISRNAELGARGGVAGDLRWSVAIFHTELSDDIQFISSGGGATSAGYFHNVGRTRRQGLELGLQGHVDALALAARYSLVDATYRTPLVLNSPNNSTAAPISCDTCADIQVRRGNRLPAIARHTAKLHAAWTFRKGAVVGMTLVAQSGTYARGDENNADVRGRVPGFTLVNLDARLPLGGGWEAFADVDNLFDRRTSSFGTLGRNVFTGPDRTFDPTGTTWRSEQFRVAGAPLGAWLGVTWHFGAQAGEPG
jgi:outer membrane receptor protein involved in Fe transport